MKLRDITPCLMGSDRIIIKNVEGLTLYHGFYGLFEENSARELLDKDYPVTRITYSSDLTARDYQEKGYSAPIDPHTAPDYEYKDLIQRLYLEITINTEGSDQDNENSLYMQSIQS